MKQKNVILMVVAVGCGLVAAFLTSQMSSKQVEQVEVIVAAKDLTVGAVFSKDELKTAVTTKKVPKDGLPPAYVTSMEELADKRLSRPIRAGETINPADLNKGISLPEGYDLMALSVGANNAVGGLIAPGTRVDVMASLRLGNTLKVFKLLVNTLIVNVNQDTANTKNGVYGDVSLVGLALTEKEAAALELAKARGCTLSLKLRHTNKKAEVDADYKIEDVIKLLEGPQDPTVVKVGNDEDKKGPTTPETPKVETPKTPEMPKVETPKVEVKPEPPVTPFAPPPSIKMVNVLVAKRFIEPNTLITNDLIKEAFEWVEKPKDSASDAITDFSEVVGNKAFKTGVAKGQWVTFEMVGIQAPKAPPQEEFVPVKPAGPEAPVQPIKPAQPPVAKKKYFDVAVHTPAGTIVYRYEELPNGKSKKVAELTPEQAARDEKPEAPQAAPSGAVRD